MASGMNYDLVVNDSNFEAVGKEYYKFGQRLEDYIERYSNILNEITSEGIKSGKVHDNLLKFMEAVDSLKRQGKDIADKAEECSNKFLEDMDTADSYLY